MKEEREEEKVALYDSENETCYVWKIFHLDLLNLLAPASGTELLFNSHHHSA